MPAEIRNIRNIGFAAHIDAGKTTVTERVLYITGKIHRMGEVHDGRAQMDWMDEEQERGISITAAATTCLWKDHLINIIDTPGHVDFTIEVERSLRVLDGVVIILCGIGGVETQTETVWAQAQHYRIPRLAFINKLDRPGSECPRVVDQMRTTLSPIPLLIQLPMGSDEEFVGVVDVVEERSYRWPDPGDVAISVEPVPAAYAEACAVARRRLLEAVADWDEAVLALMIDGKEVPADLLKAALRKGTLSLRCVPVLCGAALRNKGIQPLLDAVVDYLPSPAETPPVEGVNPLTGTPEKRSPSADEAFTALAFKVLMEAGSTLVYLRIYSGRIATGEELVNARSGRSQKVPFLFRMHANKRQQVRNAGPGDIVAAVGLKDVLTGDTLCAPGRPIVLESIHPPEPVVSMALEPKSLSERKRLLDVLSQIAFEDPTFRFAANEETGQVVASGMGELHLEVIFHRLSRDHGLEIRAGRPQVIYRETVTKPAEARADFDRLLGGKRHVGSATIIVSPARRGSGVIVETSDLDPSIPEQYVTVSELSVRESTTSGPVAGYPLDDMRIMIEEIRFQPGVTTEVGMRLAVGQALRDAMQKAKPVLMEPIMEAHVVLPAENVGEVIADLGAKGGRIEGLSDRSDGMKDLRAHIPLSQLFGYATELRSRTRGKGTFSMHFSHYDPVADVGR